MRLSNGYAQISFEFVQEPRSILVGGEAGLRAYYNSVLDKANQEEPTPKPSNHGRPKQSKGRNLLDKLRTYTGVLAFAFEDDVPFPKT